MAERGKLPTAGCEGLLARLAVASAAIVVLLVVTVTADAQMPPQPTAPVIPGAEAIVPPIRRIHPSRLAQEATVKAKQAAATQKAKGAAVAKAATALPAKTDKTDVVVHSGGKASTPKR